MCFFSNYIELLVDGWKLCQLYRRPTPKGAQDIGTWQSILEVMGFLSVLTNVGIICFTGNFMPDGYDTLAYKVILFLILEHVLMGIKNLVGAIIPDIPEDVEMQLERQSFIVSKVILNLQDDDFDDSILNQDDGEEEKGKGGKMKRAFEILHEDKDYIYPEKDEDDDIMGALGSILSSLGLGKKKEEAKEEETEFTDV